MNRYRIWGSLLLSVCLAVHMLPGQAAAAEVPQAISQVEINTTTEEQPEIQQKQTGIVLLGSSRYLEPAYLDIMSRYFVKCYSQYRYPTEFGRDMQDKCMDALQKQKLSNMHSITEQQLAQLVKDMDKEQILFIRISDMVHRQRRRIDRWLGSEDLWEANIAMEALLVDRNGIVRQEKFYDSVDEQYNPDRALSQAYTDCIRKLQKKNIFQ